MPIILPHPLSVQEIRVLQEFRRLSTENLTAEVIRKIKHPAGGSDAAALSLVEKGYLTLDGNGETFVLTEKSKKFLSIDYKPIEEAGAKSTK